MGTIENLIESDQLLLEEEGSDCIADHLRTGGRLQSPNAVFVAKLLKLKKTIDAEERYELSKSFWTDELATLHDSNQFRRDVITSIGTQLDEIVLHKNSSLKDKMDFVRDIGDLVDTVEVYYDDDAVSLSLRKGQLVSEYQNGNNPLAALAAEGRVQSPAWVITAPEGIEFEDMYSLKLYVSNLKLGAAGNATAVAPRGNILVGFDPETGAPLLQYNEGSVIATFDPYALVVCSVSSDESGNDVYTVKEVAFWFDRIQRTLEVLGIDCS
jgi:hypothetical protein